MKELLVKLFSLLPAGDGWKLVLLVSCMFLGALLELIGIALIPAFVSVLTNPSYLLDIPLLEPVWEFANVDDFESLFYFGVILLAVIFVVKNIFIIFYRYIEARYTWNRYRLV